MHRSPARRVIALLLLAAPLAAQAPPGASWIWRADSADDQRAWFVAEFTLERAPDRAELLLAADNHVQAFLNGQAVADVDDWHELAVIDVAAALVAGRNVLALAAVNDGGRAALLGGLLVDGTPVFATDAATRAFASEPPGWPAPTGGAPAVIVAPYGAQPWGRVPRVAPRALFPPAGFTCTEVASGFGSLIALTLDPRGAPVVSVEDGGLVTLQDEDGDGHFESATPFCDDLAACQGLCFTGADAWATGLGPEGLGFYHLPADETPRRAKLIAPITGEHGEHGPHTVEPGPDGRLWIMLGNHVQLGVPLAADSPCRLGYEGSVLPRLVDPNGHAVDIAQPGGTVVAWDRDTGEFTREAQGFRNAYDMAFAPWGDLFTFDSDMEWDIGLPWYRATRVVHVLPGGDYGWRTGSAVWPAWYPDSLPPVMDLGRGSPTGVAWCDSLAFPPAWRNTLLLGDWAQGRIVAVHLQPEGMSWRGRSEVLLSGRPLPVTDFVFDRTGALLITVGGRGARGALLRLSGTEAALQQPATSELRPPQRTVAVDADTDWDSLEARLNDPDRITRYFAARELERRPEGDVQVQLERDRSPRTRAEVLLVLARRALAAGEAAPVAEVVPPLLALLQPTSEPATRLVAVRALQIALLAGLPDMLDGGGQPPDPELGAQLLPLFPSGSPALDRELAALLARTEPDGARSALLDALDEQTSADDTISLLYALSALRGDASAAEARRALEHFAALRPRAGGNSYQGYLDGLERRLITQAPAAERAALRTLARPAPGPALQLDRGAPPRDPDRVRAYVAETIDAPERSAAEGALVFARTCAACHARGEFAGRGGPDLASVGARLQLGDLLTTVLEPSRDVSDQYRSTRLRLGDGRELEGLVVRDDGAQLDLLLGTGASQVVSLDDVAAREFSRVSAMPDGLLDGLSLRGVADLCAWLLAGEPPAAPAASGWEPLFRDGLGGWRADAEGWSAEHGLLRGAAGARLVAPFAAADFAFEAEVLLPAGTGAIELRDGLAVGLGGDAWGSLLGASGALIVPADRLMVDPSLQPAGWNHVLVERRGGRVRVALNGLQTAVLDEAPGVPSPLALRLDAGAPAAFRAVALRRPAP
jgi:putative heme-binding domain-containing protein